MGGIQHSAAKVAVMIGQLAQGGSEKQLYIFLEQCDRERWSPIVYVSRGPVGFWDGPIRELGIPVILLRDGPLARMMQFRRSCRVHRVQHFFSWAAHTNAYGLALWGLGIRCIGSFRNAYHVEVGAHGHTPLRWLRSWTSLAAVDTIVCNSPETAAAVRGRVGSGKRVVYVPNSVQPVENRAAHRRLWREHLGIQDHDVLVLGVGRLSVQKNFGRFVEAIALARQAVPTRAVIAGRDDGCLASLQQQAKLLGLGPDVIQFVGPVAKAQELMCAADIFMLSSDYEGMPNVVLEAMAAGVPCVCTRVNGVSELIQSGANGFIIDHRADALAGKVQLLALDRMLRQDMGARAADRIDGSFTPAAIAARLWQLLEENEVSCI